MDSRYLASIVVGIQNERQEKLSNGLIIRNSIIIFFVLYLSI